MPQQVETHELMTKGLKICENCEWCIPVIEKHKKFEIEVPRCLSKGKQTGLFEYCELFKKRTGMHISM